jgi:hypothetical protein
LITSLKVCSESKYIEPTTKVSAKTGTDVMNNAMNKDLVVTNIAANDNFVCLNLATDTTIMRFTCITSSESKVSKFQKQKRLALSGPLAQSSSIRLCWRSLSRWLL